MDNNVERMPNVAIFGDCALHAACKDIPHVAAFGLTNWLSITCKASQSFMKIDKNTIDSSNLSNYEKRICYYNFNKGFFDYLFKNKAEYLIIDSNDNRKRLIIDTQEEIDGEYSVATDNSYMKGFDGLMEKVFTNNSMYEIKNAYDIDVEKYIKSATIICDKILENYKPNQIIYVVHKPVENWYDDEGIHTFTWFDPALNKKTTALVEKIEKFVLEKLSGLNVIEFPDNVIGIANHPLGNCPLHYHNMYYEYLNKAIKIIIKSKNSNGRNYKKCLLNELKNQYSTKFNFLRNNILNRTEKFILNERFDIIYQYIRCSASLNDNLDILRKISNINNYIDALTLLKHRIIVIGAVKDTCGFYNSCITLEKLKSFGFLSYPQTLWQTYLGIVINGVCMLDYPGNKIPNEGAIEYAFSCPNLCVTLRSSPLKQGNLASIIINGTDYCKNDRGLNLVVLDSNSYNVIDSISYDSHLCDYFKRLELK